MEEIIRNEFNLFIPIDLIDLIVNYYDIATQEIINPYTHFKKYLKVRNTIDFTSDQSKEERHEMLASLSKDETCAICKSLDIILEDYKLDVHNPEYYMMTPMEYYASAIDSIPEERMYSVDWRLSIYHGNMGTIYDFNGWPGDNSEGVGLMKLPWKFEKRNKDNYKCIYLQGDGSVVLFGSIAPTSENKKLLTSLQSSENNRNSSFG